ncbi:SLOG family protein [Enterococcus columbae]|uniref:Uncharacterized protein n=1 Tax=Enterococcus columbae DSM 7374 = ATCC 51263 TaxID=1121865 RepID=S1N6F6_9ENTE|nr:SLOG family protein [Enterococcus columbae]EOT44434.1 hypothetical protein OMW_00490 [Enterococcus columbae DSM 7374 = ATCC 51263]EOW84592.1 hypothetical protein I568_01088 [Enterococcus columbae DSM 7374 = ATCC 51263]OJG20852.1 hypothetical protein RR47_GL001513 [Enterococcus columbae DSM 7374 = ATCC 51263]
MENQKIITITGYRSFELGIFQAKDPKLSLLYKFIKQSLIELLENGLEWVVIGGNLGIELWAAEMVLELKQSGYTINLAVILPFKEFGSQWNESNQSLLTSVLSKADYVNYVSQKPYEHPSQFANHTQFLAQYTDLLWAIYDEDYPGKAQFIIKEFTKIRGRKQVYLVGMEELQEFSYQNLMD